MHVPDRLPDAERQQGLLVGPKQAPGPAPAGTDTAVPDLPAAGSAVATRPEQTWATLAVQFGSGEPADRSHAADTSDAGRYIACRPALAPLASRADDAILNLPNRTQRENASLGRASEVGRATDGVQLYVRIRPSGGDGSVRMATLLAVADLRRTLAFDPRRERVDSLQVVLDSGQRLDVRPSGRLRFPEGFQARDLSDQDYAFLCAARDQGLVDDTRVLENLERLNREGGVGLGREDLQALLPQTDPWLDAAGGLAGALAGWGLAKMRAESQVAHDPAYPLYRDEPYTSGHGTLATENNAPVWGSGGHFMHTAALASLLPGALTGLYAGVRDGLQAAGQAAGLLPSRVAGETGAQDTALGRIGQAVAQFVATCDSQPGGIDALAARLIKVLGAAHRERIAAYLQDMQALAADLQRPGRSPEAHAATQARIGAATRQLVQDCGEMPSEVVPQLASAAKEAFQAGYAVYLMYLSGEEFETSGNVRAYLAAFNPFMAPVEPVGGRYHSINDWRGDVTLGNLPGAAFQSISENLDKDGHLAVSASGPLGIGGGGAHTPDSIPLPSTAEVRPDYASRVELRFDWGGLSLGSSVRSAMGASGFRDRDVLGLGSPVDATHAMSGGFHSLSWGIDPNSAVNRMKAITPGSRLWSFGATFNPGAVFSALSGTVLQNVQVAAEFTTGTAPGEHADPVRPAVPVPDAAQGRQSLLYLRADLPLADLTGTLAAGEGGSALSAVAAYLAGGVNQFLERTRIGLSYGYNWGTVDPRQHLAARPGGQFALTTRTELLALNGQESALELLGKIGWGFLSGILSYGANSGVAAINTAINGRRI